MIHNLNLNTWEAEAAGLLEVQGQPGLGSKALSQKTKQKFKIGNEPEVRTPDCCSLHSEDPAFL